MGHLAFKYSHLTLAIRKTPFGMLLLKILFTPPISTSAETKSATTPFSKSIFLINKLVDFES